MEWIQHHPKTAGAVAAVISLLVIIGIWMVISPSDSSDTTAQPEPTLPTREPLKSLPKAKDKKKDKEANIEQQVADGLAGVTGGGGGAASGDALSLPGLSGGSLYKYLPKHSITLRVTSQAPIGTVGYVMPTSLKESSGVVKNAGTSWSISSTVYGNPDYAQIFVQAGARGFPITCTIVVDGAVTEQRSTEGPYGQMVCQG